MKTKWALKTKENVQKQYDAVFIKCEQYPKWVANIMPIPKKDGRVTMCVVSGT